MDCLCADLDYSNEPAFCPVHQGTHVGVERLRAKCRKRDAEIARLKAEVERHLRCTSSYPEKQAACARKDREIARLKHTNEALEHVLRQYEKRHGVDGLIKGHIEAATIDQRHEVGMMLVDLASHKRALAAGPAALRAGAPSLWSGESAAREVERAQAEAMKEGT